MQGGYIDLQLNITLWTLCPFPNTIRNRSDVLITCRIFIYTITSLSSRSCYKCRILRLFPYPKSPENMWSIRIIVFICFLSDAVSVSSGMSSSHLIASCIS